MTRLGGAYTDKVSFHEWVMACCDTLIRNEDKIYNMLKDHTTSIDIIFPIKPNEKATMEIIVNKIVSNEEHEIVVIKNLEDKENK